MFSKANLRAWMKKNGYGPAAAAQYLNVTTRTVQRWLSGDRKIPEWLPLVIRD